MNKRIGYRELFKTGVLTAKQALDSLISEAEQNGESNLVRQSRAYVFFAGKKI